MKNKAIKPVAILTFLVGFMMPTAFAASEIVPFAYDSDYTYQEVGGIKVANCKIIEDSSIDFCSPKITKKLVAFSQKAPNFGPKKQSVLTRFWDKEMNSWFYVAVNTKTKVAHAYPRGLRSNYGDNEPSISFGKADRICTKRIGVDMVGDMETRSFSDEDETVDYCSNFDDNLGFTMTYAVDSTTRKIVNNEWF